MLGKKLSFRKIMKKESFAEPLGSASPRLFRIYEYSFGV